MTHTLVTWWHEIWPNLAASALTWLAVHLSHRRHLVRLRDELQAEIRRLEHGTVTDEESRT